MVDVMPAGCGEIVTFLQRAVELDLEGQALRLLGKIPAIVIQGRRLPELLPEQPLPVDQLQGGLMIAPDRREFSEV